MAAAEPAYDQFSDRGSGSGTSYAEERVPVYEPAVRLENIDEAEVDQNWIYQTLDGEKVPAGDASDQSYGAGYAVAAPVYEGMNQLGGPETTQTVVDVEGGQPGFGLAVAGAALLAATLLALRRRD